MNNNKFHEVKNNKSVKLSLGAGYSFSFSSNTKDRFLISTDIILQLSKFFFLDFKLDGIKQGNSYLALLNFIPEYEIQLSDDGKFFTYLGGGLTIYLSAKGHSGIDASAMTQVKFEYHISETFF